MQKVIWNGKSIDWCGSGDPGRLKLGEVYEVEKLVVSAWKTEYQLKGVEGTFNSTWFEEWTPENVYLGLAKEPPTIGEQYAFFRLTEHGGFASCTIEVVEDVQEQGSILKIISNNAWAYVQIVEQF